MNERKASCSCGQLTVTCTGDPVRVSMCHCLACQQRSGSVFAVQARFARDDVELRGTAKEWVRIGDDGGRITFRFCPSCGSTVAYEIDRWPEVIAVPVGAFAEPMFPPPTVSVYEARRHPWLATPKCIVERLD